MKSVPSTKTKNIRMAGEVQPLLAAALDRGRRQRNGEGAADAEHGGGGEREREAPAHQTISFVRSRVRSSKRELARWT